VCPNVDVEKIEPDGIIDYLSRKLDPKSAPIFAIFPSDDFSERIYKLAKEHPNIAGNIMFFKDD